MASVKVIIQDGTGHTETVNKQVGVPTAEKTMNDTVVNPNQAKASVTKSKNIAIATMLAKNSFNYATANVGKWTGNSHYQNVINNATDIVGLGVLAVVNPAIAAVTTAFKIATTAIDTAFEQQESKYASERSLARAGFSSSGEAIGYRRNKQ